MNLAALLFDVARRLPERPAVSDDRHAWNYRELAERVARIAGGLRARGLAPGDRVLLSLENCGEFVELLFGCWAAGLCAVPANARLHPREVEYIADNSGARLLIATPGLAEALAPLVGSVDTLEAVISTRTAEYDALARGRAGAPRPRRPPTDPAWLFYTSGTTGRPKGAVLTHRNLLFASQCYYADIDRLDERDTHLLAAPVSHGAGLYALPFLLKGGHQIVLPHFDVGGVLEAIAAPSARLVLRGADDADPPGARAGGRRRRPRQSEDDLLRRRPDVCRRPGKGARTVRAAPLPALRPGQVADDDLRPRPAPACRHRHPRWRERLGSCRRAAHRRAGPGGRRATTANCRPARSARSSRAATASWQAIGRTRRPMPRPCAAAGCIPAISAAWTRTAS